MIEFAQKLASKGIFTSESIVFLCVWWFSFERFAGDESVAVRVTLIAGGFAGAAIFAASRAAWKPHANQKEVGSV